MASAAYWLEMEAAADWWEMNRYTITPHPRHVACGLGAPPIPHSLASRTRACPHS